MTASSSEEQVATASQMSTAASDKLVVKNTLYLTLSQTLTIPLSILMNVAVARYLGPDAFGISYLASTLCGLGFLVFTWGHDGVLPAVVARDHSQSGTMLASSLVFRGLVFLPVYAVTAVGCYLFGYDAELQWALALTAVWQLLTAFVAGCKDAIRGLERTDIPAYAHVGQQLLAAFFVIVVLVLGGKLLLAITAQLAACAVTLVAVWFTLRPAGVTRLKVSWPAAKALFIGGTPFVVSGLVMALQPMVDAVFLSKLAPVEVTGWYAVTRRLVGVLLLPATSLIGALYPTLCRLFTTDQSGFARTASGSLRGIALLVVPVALGCALYPDVAIAMFSRKAFGPSGDNLRWLSLFVALVYFSMPLGICVLAAEKTRAWSFVQSICLVFSVALDPVLVPWFQQRSGNGGLGLCVSSTLSEVLVVVFGVLLSPRGIFDRKLIRTFLLALVSGGAMVLVAFATRSITPFVAGPIALLAYLVTLWLSGAIEKEQMDAIRGAVLRRLSRFRGSASA